MRRSGAHGGVEGDVGGLLGLRRAHVAAALVAALRRAPLAGRRPAPAIAGQRDLAHREDLALEELLGAPPGHRLGGLLAALHLARALALLAAAGVVRRLVARLGGLLGHHRGLGLLGDLLEALPGALGRGAGRLGDAVLAAPPAVGERELGGGGGVGGGDDQAVAGVRGHPRGPGAHQPLGLVPRAHGPRGAAHHDVGAMSERAGVDAHQRDEPADGRRDLARAAAAASPPR